ncbi:RNA polymerase II transcriptional regulation mediator [Trachipleistophora hominis]|uniref:Mediator of RNA polymerase II transcription subunit 6 n=1 Tax=Trachipleistophora hominis TaxID=72359 RepID=L7JS45_TRAHO|nr:RNA polymerase II transcriptional regulation mediator [Trachipleistophora hominis]
MNDQTYTNQQWLETNPLTVETVLTYFSFSPFYDRSSLNEILKMQTQFTNFLDFSKKLTELNGVKYLIEQKGDIFFIYKIHKQKDTEELLDFYYVFFGTIYKGATTNSIFRTRVFNFLFFLNESLPKYLRRRRFSAVEGFKMKSDEEINTGNAEEMIEDKEIAEYVMRDIYNG